MNSLPINTSGGRSFQAEGIVIQRSSVRSMLVLSKEASEAGIDCLRESIRD